jgi:type VI secretion system protein ImpF
MTLRPQDRRLGESARAQLPLLDRLIDDAPELPADPPLSATAALAILHRGVQRDLEALLNARRRWRSWPAALAELWVSSLGYGIADFAAGSFNDPRQVERLRAEVADAIHRFEPRLAEVQVHLAGARDVAEPVLRLRIEAVLLAEPAPEPVSFDTVLDATTADIVLCETGLRDRTHV